MPARISKHSSLVLIVLAATLVSLCHAAGVSEIAAAVSQENYRNHLRNRLYTQMGADRFAPVLGADHDRARDYIAGEFKSYGLEVFMDAFTFTRVNPPMPGSYSGVNVVAKLTGTTHPEQQYILGAHYDSARTPGADDDASGVAGLLEAARVLASHKFEYTILFIAFDFEELGCSGAGSYVMRHLNDQILGMVELDMIAYNHAGRNQAEVWTGNQDRKPDENATSKALLAAVERYGNGLTAVYKGSDPASDHGPFAGAGFAGALLTEGDPYSPYYHRQTDAATGDNSDETERADTLMPDGTPYLDYAFGTNMTRAAVGWLAEAAVLLPDPEPVPEPQPEGSLKNSTGSLATGSEPLVSWGSRRI